MTLLGMRLRRILSISLFVYLLLAFYPLNHVLCESNEKLDNIIQARDSDAPANADIIGAIFNPSEFALPDSIDIWFGVAGDFEKGLTEENIEYFILFYDSESAPFGSALSQVRIFAWMNNKTIDGLYYEKGQTSKLRFELLPETHTIIIQNINLKELGVQPEDDKYVFYVSVASFLRVGDELWQSLDFEPDAPSGDVEDSENYHARIVVSKLEVPTPTETPQSPTPTETVSPTTSPTPTTPEEVAHPTILQTIFEWLGPILISIGLVLGALMFIYGRRKTPIETKQVASTGS